MFKFKKLISICNSLVLLAPFNFVASCDAKPDNDTIDLAQVVKDNQEEWIQDLQDHDKLWPESIGDESYITNWMSVYVKPILYEELHQKYGVGFSAYVDFKIANMDKLDQLYWTTPLIIDVVLNGNSNNTMFKGKGQFILPSQSPNIPFAMMLMSQKEVEHNFFDSIQALVEDENDEDARAIIKTCILNKVLDRSAENKYYYLMKSDVSLIMITDITDFDKDKTKATIYGELLNKPSNTEFTISVTE